MKHSRKSIEELVLLLVGENDMEIPDKVKEFMVDQYIETFTEEELDYMMSPMFKDIRKKTSEIQKRLLQSFINILSAMWMSDDGSVGLTLGIPDDMEYAFFENEDGAVGFPPFLDDPFVDEEDEVTRKAKNINKIGFKNE